MFNASRNKSSFVFFIAIAALIAAFPVFAQALPWESPLQTLATSLTGPTAGAIALIALFAAGAVLVFGGEISDFAKRLIYIVIAVSLLIGGAALLRMIGVAV
jgi:type IV secretion system protein TrbC